MFSFVSKEKQIEEEMNKKVKLQFKKFLPNAQEPLRASKGAAAYDLFAATETIKNEITGPMVEYDTGIGVKIPDGYVGLIAPRSSIAVNTTLMLANSVGVIDSDYTGSISFKFRQINPNFGKKYKVGDRIGQLMIIPVMELELEEVKELPQTERGSGSYGSTGK